MNEKEQLIKMLYEYILPLPFPQDIAGWCADSMIERSVTVLPCKVGDTIYVPFAEIRLILEFRIVKCEIYEDKIIFTDDHENAYHINAFGKSVFTSREEAERFIERKWNNARDEQ